MKFVTYRSNAYKEENGKMKNKFSTKLLSILLCLTLVMTYLPFTAMAAPSYSSSIADPKTLSDWEKWFLPESSRYAGGVFLDKSVYTASEALSDPYFSDIRDNLSFGEDNFGNENFLVALSALGSNSEIKGYSYTPTDTIIVLDASTSMGTGAAATSSIDDMVNGANEALKRLLELNNHNRVGVVIYNGSARVLLPLNRYTSRAANGNILRYSRQNDTNRIYIANDVYVGNTKVDTNYIAQSAGTYTQGGFYAAAQEFLAADTTIEDGKIQAGTKRLPIMVFMSDGQPSYRTKTGSNTTVDKYTQATNANCDNSDFREDDITAFGTMLTAAWAEAEISEHYGQDARFYTLGYNLDADHNYAHNVLDPMNPNNNLYNRFKGFADTYLGLTQNSTGTFIGGSTFRVKRASSPEKVTSLDYVDRYWQTQSASGLTQAFDSIVDEIVIQSRYYSTHISGTEIHQDGYISFTDEIGTHMKVKDMKGLYIGEGKLVTGGMFAEFATTGKVSDFDSDRYSEEQLEGFENEVLSAVAERFGISVSEATLLLNTAKDSGFIRYTSPDDFSNYLAWYADEENNYIMPYSGIAAHDNEDSRASDAKYIIRSYFYMGDVTQNHVESSMLYSLVRVREDIDTGRQIVDINVPASLLPMVTYTITVSGDELRQDNLIGMTYEPKKPISLLFEVGLDNEITPYNISEKMKGEDFRRGSDGVYTFYTNRWRNNEGTVFTIPKNPDPHIFNHGIMNTTVAQFIPSIENERYYYTENTQVLDSNYRPYTGTRPAGSGFYTEHKWIEKSGNRIILNSAYNPISASLLEDTESVVQIQGQNGWFILKDSPEFYFGEEVHGEQAHAHKSDNTTETLGWSNYPHIEHHEAEEHNGYHVLHYLGNNGSVRAVPAQGIKLTKTLSAAVDGASDTFTFNISLSGANLAASYPVHIVSQNGVERNTSAIVSRDTIQVTIKAGDTAYITGLPAGAQYTVTEAYSAYYTAKSENATGTIGQFVLAEVHFENTPKGYGSLLVEKDVTHPFTVLSDELAAKEFEILVTFTGDENDLAQIIAPQNAVRSNNTYKFTLSDGTDVRFTNIPEGVEYSVSENNIPDGFTLTTDAQNLEGEIATGIESEVMLVNDYEPDGVSANITVQGEKTVSGREWDNNIDLYKVALQRVVFGGQGTVAVGNPIIVDVVKANGADYSIDMSGIVYDDIGTYSYVVYEVKPENGAVEDIFYDTSIGAFSVSVTDNGSGKLIIYSVVAHQGMGTVESGTNGYIVNKDFTNIYMATTVTVPIVKNVVREDDPSQTVLGHSGGIMMGLFGSVSDNQPIYSTITDQNGNARITINVTQSDFEDAKYFYLREIIPLTGSQVVGMTYDTGWKYVVEIDWSDAMSAEPEVHYYRYDANAANGIGAQVSDIANEPFIVTNAYDDGVVSNELNFSGKKTLNGGALRSGDSFSFSLYQTDATFSITNTNAKVLDTVSATADSNGRYALGGVSFDQEGTYYLAVAENAGAQNNGIGYDNSRYHITVNVAKTLNGNKTVLTATATHIHLVGSGDVEADEINFNNTYRINDTESVTVRGKKILPERELIEGEFLFGLYERGNAIPIATARNSADGTFAFETLEYNIYNAQSFADTEYTYEIREIIENPQDLKGITYDDTVYVMKVILKDNGDGTIAKSVTLDGVDVSGEIEVEFENHYTVLPTELTLSGTKFLEGKSEGEFTFNLYETGADFAISDMANPYKTATARVYNSLGEYGIELTFDKSDRGYHYYVLMESVPADTKGVQYDITRYYITVNVRDNGHGEMDARVFSIVCPYYEGNFTAQTLDFTNRYNAASTEYSIAGTKILEGREPAENEFEFELYEADSEFEIGQLLLTANNNIDGGFEFAPGLVIEDIGEYFFVVAEKNNGIERITYDDTLFGVAITVVDNGEGNLVIENEEIYALSEEEMRPANMITFTNVYTPKPADISVDIDVKKTVINKGSEKIGPEGFEFVLENTESGEKQSVMSDANGRARFSLGYSEDDAGKTYTYKLTEVDGGRVNVQYSNAEYEVGVEILLNENNELVAVITLNGNRTDGAVAEFENVYDYSGEGEKDTQSPKTGYNKNIALLFALMFVSGSGMISAPMFGKRKEKNK